MHALVRAAALGLVRLAYPVRSVHGDVPADGPLIVVANHPNGLLDPLVLTVALGRPMAFLAKHTLFHMPVLAQALPAFQAIPVTRAKEGDTSANTAMFARARAHLAGGGWLALFPEGVSHDATRLLPLRTGAARIAHEAPPGTRILPVGLTYADKGLFRSRVSVHVGEPLEPSSTDDARALTEQIAAALRAQILEADDATLWHGFRAAAAWLAEPGEDRSSADRRARDLSAAWRAADPDVRERLAEEARALSARLRALGVEDPLLLDAGVPGPAAVLRAVTPLVLLAPLAVIGTLLCWVPYRLARTVAGRLTQDADQLLTMKLVAGSVLLGAWWLLLAAAAAWTAGAPYALATLLLAPASGYTALRWDERRTARGAHGRAAWILLTARGTADAVRVARRDFAAHVAAALAEAGQSPAPDCTA
jgi:glycerol-3-phosphate O-acyltransferase/dihydroxyacetone phosphate acyltransferase